ncbi:MAG: penicillin-binding transpeptidase domain-containing protein, partial [Fervidobacterium pennivorans]
LGSAIKPFYYYLAFMAGYNLDDILLDKPIKIGRWEPENFDKKFRGQVTIEYALAHSLNIPSIDLFLKLGQGNVTNFLKNTLMISGFYPNDATLALGTLETSVADVAQGYSPIFTGGLVIKPRIVEYVKDKNGYVYYSYTPALVNVVKPPKGFDKRTPLEASILTLRAMEKVVTEGTSRSAQMPGRKIYGKSGSAENYAWFVGGDGKYLFILARDNVKEVSGLVVTPKWREIAVKTEIGYTPISLPINSKIQRFNVMGDSETLAEPKTVTGEVSENATVNQQEVATSTVFQETNQDNLVKMSREEIISRVKTSSITANELVEVLKSYSPDERRAILSEINSLSQELAAEVYQKLLDQGIEF